MMVEGNGQDAALSKAEETFGAGWYEVDIKECPEYDAIYYDEIQELDGDLMQKMMELGDN